MKYLILLLLPFFAACSGSDSSSATPPDLDQTCVRDSSIIGTWEDAELDELGFANDCTGWEQNCNVNFEYNKPDQGQIKLEITWANGASCADIGDVVTCTIEEGTTGSNSYVTLNCGSGFTETFFK